MAGSAFCGSPSTVGQLGCTSKRCRCASSDAAQAMPIRWRTACVASVCVTCAVGPRLSMAGACLCESGQGSRCMLRPRPWTAWKVLAGSLSRNSDASTETQTYAHMYTCIWMWKAHFAAGVGGPFWVCRLLVTQLTCQRSTCAGSRQVVRRCLIRAGVRHCVGRGLATARAAFGGNK